MGQFLDILTGNPPVPGHQPDAFDLGTALDTFDADLQEMVGRDQAARVVTVGTGGDFATINAALAEISDTNQRYAAGGQNVEISLLTGFVMSEQVMVKNASFANVRITSQDASVQIDRNALSVADTIGTFPAFCAENGALPEIATLFDMDLSGLSADRHGVCLINGGYIRIRADCGFINCSGTGLVVFGGSRAVTGDHDIDGVATVGGGGAKFTGCGAAGVQVRNGSVANLIGADVSGSQTGIFVRSSCMVDFWHGIATNCTGSGARVRDGSTCNARSADVSGSVFGLFASHGANVNFRLGVANDCTANGVRAYTGSTIEMPGASITDTLDTGSADSDAGSGVSVTNGARVNAAGSDTTITGSAKHSIHAEDGSTVSADNAIISGAAARPVNCVGSFVSVSGADATGCGQGLESSAGGQVAAVATNVGAVGAGDAFEVVNGGIISAKNSIGSKSVAVNAITGAGIIFD